MNSFRKLICWVRGQRRELCSTLCNLTASLDEHAEYDEFESEDEDYTEDEFPAYWIDKANTLLTEIEAEGGGDV